MLCDFSCIWNGKSKSDSTYSAGSIPTFAGRCFRHDRKLTPKVIPDAPVPSPPTSQVGDVQLETSGQHCCVDSSTMRETLMRTRTKSARCSVIILPRQAKLDWSLSMEGRAKTDGADHRAMSKLDSWLTSSAAC